MTRRGGNRNIQWFGGIPGRGDFPDGPEGPSYGPSANADRTNVTREIRKRLARVEHDRAPRVRRQAQQSSRGAMMTTVAQPRSATDARSWSPALRRRAVADFGAHTSPIRLKPELQRGGRHDGACLLQDVDGPGFWQATLLCVSRQSLPGPSAECADLPMARLAIARSSAIHHQPYRTPAYRSRPGA
jgi:hypothetical protein